MPPVGGEGGREGEREGGRERERERERKGRGREGGRNRAQCGLENLKVWCETHNCVEVSVGKTCKEAAEVGEKML